MSDRSAPYRVTWRDRLAGSIANFALRHIATEHYRDFIDGSIRLGIRSAVDQAEREQAHTWEGHALSDEDGSWVCIWCSAVCDHVEPCGRHGKCSSDRSGGAA